MAGAMGPYDVGGMDSEDDFRYSEMVETTDFHRNHCEELDNIVQFSVLQGEWQV